MHIYGPTHLHGAQSISPPHTTRMSQPASRTDATAIQDEVTISDAARLAEQVHQTPDIRQDRVNAIRAQIADTTEITAEGPIHGSLWVTGYVPIERADGKPFETRNRVTLCNCGESKNKPLCDGTHRHIQEEELKRGKSNQ